jgi:hypothetical protein
MDEIQVNKAAMTTPSAAQAAGGKAMAPDRLTGADGSDEDPSFEGSDMADSFEKPPRSVDLI